MYQAHQLYPSFDTCLYHLESALHLMFIITSTIHKIFGALPAVLVLHDDGRRIIRPYNTERHLYLLW